MELSRVITEGQMSGRRDKNQNIQVFVRVRPLSVTETAKHYSQVIDTPGSREVVVRERPGANFSKTFTFDKVFGQKSKQIDVYKAVVAPLLNEVLLGYNCTVFAYGQTGTGKTFTMEGERSQKGGFGEGGVRIENDINAGILPRALSQLFDEIRMMNCEFSVRVSFLELYNEELFDLLAPIDENKYRTLRLYEDSHRKGSVIINGLEEVVVNNKHEVYAVLDRGSQQRKTAATLMNATSSRSHSIFTITVHTKDSSVEGEEMVKVGKLHLVDLAGSENIGKSGAVDKRAREAGLINQSLLTLGRVITALVEKTPHVPYRESKLTRLLQDSLGGKTKTSIIATVSPASFNLEETLNTLEYAHRAKNIMNKPEVNQRVTKKEVLSIYTEEIERLRRDLIATREKNGIFMDQDHYNHLMYQVKSQCEELNEKSNTIRDLQENITKKDVELFEAAELIEEYKEDAHVRGKIIEDYEERNASLTERLAESLTRTDELNYLVKCHVDTETKLTGEANILLGTTKDTVCTIDSLYARLERKKAVAEKNWQSAERFREEFRHSVNDLCNTLNLLRKAHVLYTTGLRQNNENFVSQRKSSLELFENKFQHTTTELFICSEKIGSAALTLKESIHGRFNTENSELSQKCLATKEHYKKMKDDMITTVMTIQSCTSTLQEEIKNLKVDVENKFGKMEHELVAALSIDKKMFEGVEEIIKVLKTSLAKMMEDVVGYSRSFELTQQNFKDTHGKKIAQMQKILNELISDSEAYIDVSTTCKEDLVKNITMFHTEHVDVISDQEKSITLAKQAPAKAIKEFNQYREENVVQRNISLDNMYEKVNEGYLASCKVENEINDMYAVSNTYIEETVASVRKTAEKHLQAVGIFRREALKDLKNHQLATDELKELVNGQIGSVLKEDEDNAVSLIQQADSHCDVVSDNVTKITSAIQSSGGSVDEFWEGTYLLDLPTGATPMRRKFDYPVNLSATSPHERVIARYRSVKNYVQSTVHECTYATNSSGSQRLSGHVIPMPSLEEEDNENVPPAMEIIVGEPILETGASYDVKSETDELPVVACDQKPANQEFISKKCGENVDSRTNKQTGCEKGKKGGRNKRKGGGKGHLKVSN